MTDNLDAVHTVLQNLPGFAGLPPEEYSIDRLGGLTNLVYRVQRGSEKMIVRLAGSGTEDYIDRKVELHNAKAAAKAGVSAQILWANVDSGVMICECIEPAVTMTPDQFRQRAGSPARAGRALNKLHSSGETFEFRFELFAMIDEYLGILSGKDVPLPEGYDAIVEAAQPIKQLLIEKPLPLAPCHCDPLCENFLDNGEEMKIIDWEYSGMNDPLWDLGDLSVEAEFSDDQDLEMLDAYFGRPPTAAEQGRMVIYKAMCDLLWTLWGLIQHADGNEAEDFLAYANNRFSRCRKLMQNAGFRQWVEALRQS